MSVLLSSGCSWNGRPAIILPSVLINPNNNHEDDDDDDDDDDGGDDDELRCYGMITIVTIVTLKQGYLEALVRSDMLLELR